MAKIIHYCQVLQKNVSEAGKSFCQIMRLCVGAKKILI